MCTIDDWETGGSRVMSMELIDKLAEEIAPHADWVEQICLNRDGEPTLDKQLPERVHRLKQAGARKVTFATNGQLLSEELVVQLYEACLDEIMVSIDGSTKETFERIRVRLDFDVVVANTLRLIELRNQQRPNMTVRVRAVVMPENEHEITQIISY
jgi:molybdenum cofactor biosynthesis enzyme MoaA